MEQIYPQKITQLNQSHYRGLGFNNSQRDDGFGNEKNPHHATMC
jgi:hypothetical protein